MYYVLIFLFELNQLHLFDSNCAFTLSYYFLQLSMFEIFMLLACLQLLYSFILIQLYCIFLFELFSVCSPFIFEMRIYYFASPTNIDIRQSHIFYINLWILFCCLMIGLSLTINYIFFSSRDDNVELSYQLFLISSSPMHLTIILKILSFLTKLT